MAELVKINLGDSTALVEASPDDVQPPNVFERPFLTEIEVIVQASPKALRKEVVPQAALEAATGRGYK